MMLSPGFYFSAFQCVTTQHTPVGEVLRLSSEEAEANFVSWWEPVTNILPSTAIPPDSSTNLQTGNLWIYAPNGSRCVHRHAVIRVTSKINTNRVKTFPTPKGEDLTTVSPYINGSAQLVKREQAFRPNGLYLSRALQTLYL